jgi:uncharacterized protein with von Willebrand factor type A (vWA) domain
MLEAIEKIKYTKGGTRTYIAIQRIIVAIKAIQTKRGTNIPTVVVITTDGRSTSTKRTLEEAAKLKAMTNVRVFSIAIGKKVNAAEVKAIATDDTTLYRIETFDQLDDIIYKLSQGITCEGISEYTLLSH